LSSRQRTNSPLSAPSTVCSWSATRWSGTSRRPLVFEGAHGAALDPELLLSRLRTHIRTVVGRYRGRVHAWDVVNEAFEDDGTWRKTPWYTTLGGEFVAKAFEFAHEADPDAQLYYNDYNLWKMPKCRAAVRLVKSLGERGIRIGRRGRAGALGAGGPRNRRDRTRGRRTRQDRRAGHVHGVGHRPLPRPEELIGADVSKRVERTAELDPYADGLPEGVQQRLAQRYGDVFDMFVKHRAVSRVTFWNVTDADTWLNNWPVPGRTNHPLLWDRQGRPKAAFDAVVNALRRG